MADVFNEQIVKKKRDFTDIIKIILIILAAFVVDSVFLIIGVLRTVFPAVFAISVILLTTSYGICPSSTSIRS